MKTIIAVIVFGLILLAIIAMVVINFTYKGVRKIKEEVEVMMRVLILKK